MEIDPPEPDPTSPQLDASPAPFTPAHGHGQLLPFSKGDPRAVEAGRKGGQAASLRRAASSTAASDAAAVLDGLRGSLKREQLGGDAALVAGLLLARIASGSIRLRGADVAAVLRVCVDIARLEEGQATSQTLVAHLSGDAVRSRVADLQRQARSILSTSATATAAADGLDVEEGRGSEEGSISAGLVEGGRLGDGGAGAASFEEEGEESTPPPPAWRPGCV